MLPSQRVGGALERKGQAREKERCHLGGSLHLSILRSLPPSTFPSSYPSSRCSIHPFIPESAILSGLAASLPSFCSSVSAPARLHGPSFHLRFVLSVA